MALFLRRNEFEGEDFSVIYRDADGTEHDIGRIFKRMAGQPQETPWFWAVEFHQREGRTPPHQGVDCHPRERDGGIQTLLGERRHSDQEAVA